MTNYLDMTLWNLNHFKHSETQVLVVWVQYIPSYSWSDLKQKNLPMSLELSSPVIDGNSRLKFEQSQRGAAVASSFQWSWSGIARACCGHLQGQVPWQMSPLKQTKHVMIKVMKNPIEIKINKNFPKNSTQNRLGFRNFDNEVIEFVIFFVETNAYTRTYQSSWTISELKTCSK